MSDEAIFGDLSPAEASRKRWEKARKTESQRDLSADPRMTMLASLAKKAEQGDVAAYRAWSHLREEIDRERLEHDHADGPEYWEGLTPQDRRDLLDLLEGLRDGRYEVVAKEPTAGEPSGHPRGTGVE
jgi:hypothetical protein